MFGLLSTGDYEVDYRNYCLFSITCLVAGLSLFCRILHFGLDASLAAVLLFTVWFEPSASDGQVGNVNAIQLLLLAGYVWLISRPMTPARDLTAGAMIGFAVAFKPNLVWIVAFLCMWGVASRAYGALCYRAVGAAATVFVAFVISVASFGTPRVWWQWIVALSMLPDEIITLGLGNFAPALLLGEWVGFGKALIFLHIAVALVSLVGMWWLRRREPWSANATLAEALVVALACLSMLLASRLAWVHYFVLTIPMLLILLRPFVDARPQRGDLLARRFFPALAILGLATLPFHRAGISMSAKQMAVMACGATLLLLVLGVRELRALVIQRGAGVEGHGDRVSEAAGKS